MPVHFETAPAPLVKLLSPLDGEAVVAPGPLKLTASASQPLGRIVRVDYFAGGSPIGSSSIPPYTVNWSNVPYPGHSDYAWVSAEATDNLGTGGTAKSAYALVFLDGVRLAITSPADEADVRVPRVEIKGTYGGGPPSSILVNGVNASFSNGAFSAVVPLNLGGNRLEVVATSALGTTTKTVIVSYVQSTVKLTAPRQYEHYASPATIYVSATTEHFDRPVKRVEFWSHDSKVATAFAEPWIAAFQLTKPGSYLVYARAFDIDDTMVTSEGRYVSIDYGVGAFIVSPSDNSGFAEGVTIEIGTYINTGGANINRAELLMDGAPASEIRPQNTSTMTWVIRINNAALGSHAFVVRSTDAAGLTVQSEPLHVEVRPGPTAALVSPKPDSTFKSPATIVLAPKITKGGSEIQVVEFFANDLRVARLTEKPFIATWSDVPNGTYELSLRVTDVSSRSATSALISIVVADSALNFDMPLDNETIYEPTTIVAGTFDPAGAAMIQVNGVTAQTGNGTFAAKIPLDIGPNVITVAGIFGTYTTHRSIHVTRAEPSISFTNIANGDVVHDDVVTIRGFVRAPRNSGLLVNGAAVAVDATGEFFANDVRLAIGSNSIPFKLVRQDGSTVNWSLTGITRDRVQPFVMQMTPTSGFSLPLRSTLTLKRRAPADYTRLVISAGGQPILDEVVTGSTNERTFELQFKSFVAAEIRIQLFDAAGVEVFNRMMVARVTSPEELDSEIRYLYKSTINRMLAGDLAGASTAYLPQLQADYQALYEDLGANVRALSDILRDISEVNFGDASAEIKLRRQETSGGYGYPVGLMRDDNRIWRISGM